MAKKSKSKSTATSLDASPASSPPATAAGTSTALASSSTNNAAMESSTGSIASTSTSSQIDTSTKQVRAVDVAEDEDAEELPEIQVNKWSLHDLKTACDDAVKQVRPGVTISICQMQYHAHSLRPNPYSTSPKHPNSSRHMYIPTCD